MSGRLEGKTAIVTGGGSGIGRATAQRFAKEGARVLIAGRRQSKLEEVAASDGNIAYVVADLTKSEDVAKLVEEAKKRFGSKLDILVNNAGWCPVQSIKEITMADYDKAFSLDVRAVVDMTIQCLPMLIAQRGTSSTSRRSASRTATQICRCTSVPSRQSRTSPAAGPSIWQMTG